MHSRRWLAGVALANALFFGPMIGVLIAEEIFYSVPYKSILSPWQYALYGAILNIGFLTMPLIQLARNTRRSPFWAMGQVGLIALFSLAYVGFIPITFQYFWSRKAVDSNENEEALPSLAFPPTQ
ncbi:MAG TPA: hypothetical protein VK171_00310 [Fimbriimonas sp.]|nr:hypothetical protein [Fimbriimonas sp.]